MRFEPAGMTDDPDVRMAASVMDYIFRRLALDFLPYDTRAELGIFTAKERAAQVQAEAAAEAAAATVDLAGMAASAPVSAPVGAAAPTAGPGRRRPRPRRRRRPRSARRPSCSRSCMGQAADAPLCFTCGTKMRRAGSCYVCEGCGSTSGCS